MGRASTKENKTKYQLIREELGLSREKASELLETIMPESTSVTGLQIAADGMNVTFACENKEEAAYLIMALRELQYADLQRSPI